MRVPLIAGNWKMYKTSGEAARLVQDLAELVADLKDVKIVVCPPFTALKSVSVVIELDKPNFELGAQDVHWEEEGAYTGEISPTMLTELGVKYVIVGHSERRQYFGETDQNVNRKVKAVLGHGLAPIMCVGETLEQHEKGKSRDVVQGQVLAGLEGVAPEDAQRLIVAYEPIWAIGTGKTALPEDANDVIRLIRALVSAGLGQRAAQEIPILYGGSIKPDNIREFVREPEIDGALVGGASLEAESFASICRITAEVRAPAKP